MSVTGEDSQASEAPTTQRPEIDLFGQTADRCANCGADLASDQRYCVECGTRRGRPRFDLTSPFAGSTPPPIIAPDSSAAQSASGVRSISSSTALLGTVGLLLLALLVGFFIGHSANHNSASGTPKVTINETGGPSGSAGTAATGDTGAAANAGSGSTSSGSSSRKRSSSTPKGSDATVSSASAKVTSKAGLKAAKQAAATKGGNTSGLGISTKHEAPATQKVGGKCTPGQAGCSSSGTFNGNAF